MMFTLIRGMLKRKNLFNKQKNRPPNNLLGACYNHLFKIEQNKLTCEIAQRSKNENNIKRTSKHIRSKQHSREKEYRISNKKNEKKIL